MKRALTASRDQARLYQAAQVMTQGRRRCLDPGLNLACARTPGASLEDDSNDRQPDRVAKRLQLLGVTLEFRSHIATSSIIEVDAQARWPTCSACDTKTLLEVGCADMEIVAYSNTRVRRLRWTRHAAIGLPCARCGRYDVAGADPAFDLAGACGSGGEGWCRCFRMSRI